MTNIYIVDNLPPEACAMVQALYSRSPKSVVHHLEDVRTRGADKFMSTYYVGYGHKSIGDCGSTSLFIEGCSMLAAKAIQDWPLYSGQEASTRYLDMSKAVFIGDQHINERWRAMYVKVLDAMIPFLTERYPIADGQDPNVYAKAIRARAFDVARGFLPAGATTFVSWHSNLRQIGDHLQGLLCHPLEEVREIAGGIRSQLISKYPGSFKERLVSAHTVRSIDTFAYYDGVPASTFSYTNRLMVGELGRFSELLTDRPPKTELHHRLRQYGTIDFSFPLDFGSYRDLQRHRAIVQEMPLLTINHGFHPWYLEQLPSRLQDEVPTFLKEQEALIADQYIDEYGPLDQYNIAMGYTVACELSCSLPAAVYLAELRSSDSVHPTLRVQAQRMGEAIAECVPGIKLHCDMSPGTWNIKRGTHDIVAR